MKKSKRKEKAIVKAGGAIGENIYELWLETSMAKDANPGQLVGVYSRDKSLLLPRPISICETDSGKTSIRLVYRIAGKGTLDLANLRKGDEIELLGVLGNGFPWKDHTDKNIIVMAGGIGIPPMLQLSREIAAAKTNNRSNTMLNIVLGYRDNGLFLSEELKACATEDHAGRKTFYIATEDGSVGTRGNVLDAVMGNKITGDVIFACGPMPMLKAIKSYAAENNIEAYISLEERMACGVGACLGCVCPTVEKNAHSNVNNARICTEGPVFDAREVNI